MAFMVEQWRKHLYEYHIVNDELLMQDKSYIIMFIFKRGLLNSSRICSLHQCYTVTFQQNSTYENKFTDDRKTKHLIGNTYGCARIRFCVHFGCLVKNNIHVLIKTLCNIFQ